MTDGAVVHMYSQGLQTAFLDGEQVPELQEPQWIMCWFQVLEAKGIDIEKLTVFLPNGQQVWPILHNGKVVNYRLQP